MTVVTLQGKIGDGQGLASGWLKDPVFTKMIGSFYPASLNVFVGGRHSYAPNTNYPSLTFLEQQGGLITRRCLVNGVEAHLLRCECPGPTYRKGPLIPAPHTMFEIVATSLIAGISWGCDVTLEIDDTIRWLPWPD